MPMRSIPCGRDGSEHPRDSRNGDKRRVLGDLESKAEAEGTQRPQHHPWAAVLRLLSKEPAGKGINSPFLLHMAGSSQGRAL